MNAQSTAIQEAETLRAQLKAFEGAVPVRQLDPASIVRSKWANRHEAHFDTPEFDELRQDIQRAGGNVQPIKVRPKAGEADRYELVYGHRRHQACLQLGLPVRAVIEPVSDRQLFEQMERENRGRANLSAWERGCAFRKALDEGLYPSMRQLAIALGEGDEAVDLSLVSKSVALARLPGDVIDAFASPLDIQYRWSKPLTDLQDKDPETLLARARAIKAMVPRPPAAKVFAMLTGQEVLNGSTPTAAALQIKRGHRKLAELSTDAKGRALLRFEAGVLPPARHKALLQLIEEFLA